MGSGSGVRAGRSARAAGGGTRTAASAARRARVLRARGVTTNRSGRSLVRLARGRRRARG